MNLRSGARDGLTLCRGGTARNHRDERQPEQVGKISFRNGCRAGRGFHHGRVLPDVPVANGVQEQ